MGVQDGTVHLLSGQKRLKDDYKDPDVLPKFNNAKTAGTIEVIKKNLKSCHGLIKASLASVKEHTAE